MAEQTWPAIDNETFVERLIPAVQLAIVREVRGTQGVPDDEEVYLPAPDVANVLLMVLATVLEPSPVCSTPMGMRQMGEAAGKELGLLIRDTRRLKLAQESAPGSLQ